MALRSLREAASSPARVQGAACVVGAGIAGLLAAVRLARQVRGRVIVVESGAVRDDPALAPLDQLANPSATYRGPERARGLGGTSVRWAGKLLPLSRADAAPRPWIDAPGWPFPLSELDRYTRELEALMGVDHAPYDEDASALLDPGRLLPRGDADFALRWPKRPSAANHDLAHVLRHELGTRDNLEVWLGATVTRLEIDRTRGRVVAMHATDYAGRRLSVEADAFLLAAGTLESTRLLLQADRDADGFLSRTGDTLGRHFNDHLGLNIATLRPRAAAHVNRMLADRWLLGADRHLHVELRPEVQRAHAIGSAYFDVGVEVPSDSSLTQARLALRAARERRPRSLLRHARGALDDLPTLARTAQWRLLQKQKYWPPYATAQIKVWIEQAPRRDNRLTLSAERDALGQRRLAVHFQRTDAEERTLRTSVAKIHAFWARHAAGCCDLSWSPVLSDPGVRLADAAVELFHPAGSTRMGRDPATSVVDPSLRVHQLSNLHVASASVFPSSGSANPTFTIMQLALRAADAIGTSLG